MNQLLGSILFKSEKTQIDDQVIESFDSAMITRSYQKIFAELSPAQRKVMLAFGKEKKPMEICEELNIGKSTLSIYKRNLIEKGLLLKEDSKRIEFALPRFKEFLRFQALIED